MTDITHEYATDPLTGETVAIDPPLQGSEAPLMGNPVLTRRTTPRRAGSNTPLYAAGAAIAVIVLGGGAYLAANGMQHRDSLTTSAPTAPVTQEAAAIPSATPAPAPVVASVPPAPVLASAEQPVAPIQSPSVRTVHRVQHQQSARAAEDESADTSASAPQTATVIPQQSQVATAPVTATPAPAPAEVTPAPEAAPVITPPSN